MSCHSGVKGVRGWEGLFLKVMALERASGGPDNVSVVLIKTAVSSVQID